jgi:predicted amidohydrolase
LVQLAVSPSKEENSTRVVSTIEQVGRECDLIVFPEYCMGYPNEGLSRKFVDDLAEPVEGKFVTAAAEASKSSPVSVVLPIFERENAVVYNTAIVINQGEVRGKYRKIHLFDALGWRESDFFRPGSNPAVFSVGGLKVGIVICYDIRFPELIRREVLSGARAVVAPSGWVKGPLKEEQWQTLLMARAQENTSYMVGVGNANPAFVGRSLVIDPLGVKALDLGVGDGLGFCEIDEEKIKNAREALPVIKQISTTHYDPCIQI